MIGYANFCQSKTVGELRRDGCVVVVFTPDEVKNSGMRHKDFTDELIKAGNDLVGKEGAE